MKKLTKKGLKNKLDKLVSEIVRARGFCERCRSVSNLQCCHINSRKYNLTRWDLDNLMCLCATCHAHFHDHPAELGEFVKKLKGGIIYDNLKEVYKTITKYTIADLEIKLKVLQSLQGGER